MDRILAIGVHPWRHRGVRNQPMWPLKITHNCIKPGGEQFLEIRNASKAHLIGTCNSGGISIDVVALESHNVQLLAACEAQDCGTLRLCNEELQVMPARRFKATSYGHWPMLFDFPSIIGAKFDSWLMLHFACQWKAIRVKVTREHPAICAQGQNIAFSTCVNFQPESFWVVAIREAHIQRCIRWLLDA